MIGAPIYNPTSVATPNPRRLNKLSKSYCQRWVSVTEALPPERLNVLVIVRGDDCPAYAWLKYAAGDKACPYFVCPQLGAIEVRGPCFGQPNEGRVDITYWYAPLVDGLPMRPKNYEMADWGLSGYGWETREAALNPKVKDHEQP